MESIKELLKKNKWAIGFGVAAIIVILLFVWLRWWALLVIIGIAVATVIGHLMDKGGVEEVKDFFARLFSKK